MFGFGKASFEKQRAKLVASLADREITDAKVLEAFGAVPREAFVAEVDRPHAYDDGPLAIGFEQTISQPYMVAVMVQALQLQPEDRALEVGAGSGYAAAILGKIAREVVAIERIAALAEQASNVLANLGMKNVSIHHTDGTEGWSVDAPYDAILVSAGGPQVPPSLIMQLAVGGRLVIPVGEKEDRQKLLRVTRISEGETTTEDLGGCRFVPLVGKEGWKEKSE